MKKNGGNVGVDEKYVSDSNNKTEKTAIKIGVGIVTVWTVMGILFLGTVIFIVFTAFGFLNKTMDSMDKAENTMEESRNQAENIKSERHTVTVSGTAVIIE